MMKTLTKTKQTGNERVDQVMSLGTLDCPLCGGSFVGQGNWGKGLKCYGCGIQFEVEDVRG